ncbi:FAD-dependent oxidoreductase [Spongisporangium articulatum]|uniref:FAD-dependent oxidoreductase n=1 Tax=Spongisporangium articulatum TaxID=3362603 RepID=A0ABW8ART7_9ACTN
MTDTPAYHHLGEPLQLGPLRLRNRLVMGSMHTGLENRARDVGKLTAYFAERARGGVGLIVTGGYAPNTEGWLSPFASTMSSSSTARRHRPLTAAVRGEGAAIALQLLHAGRYGYHPFVVSASSGKSPISMFRARGLSGRGVRRTIDAFVRSAALAREAGYDGVEIMGSEGYLINQFLAERTNRRTDAWGGDAARRRAFAVEIVRRTRAELGPDFLVMYRMSVLDLVERGQTWAETADLAREIEAAGASVITTGIGWHEARVPTIVSSVPRAAFAWATRRLKDVVTIPVAASNRINDPEVAEHVLATGGADLIQMSRPFLADPAWAAKALAGRPESINTCIACNQACLDHIFVNRRATCLVNPRACFETELVLAPTVSRKKVAVVGAGPAGLACAVATAERGHEVHLFEASDALGGQFDLARRIPGKEEFAETLRYYRYELDRLGAVLHLGTTATAESLLAQRFDHIVVATGVTPRVPAIAGIEHPKVLRYDEALRNPPPGRRVAVVGAGGIGVDVAEFLTHTGPVPVPVGAWQAEWGVDDDPLSAGGLTTRTPEVAAREVYLLQRSPGRIGAKLGKTSGWVHRAALKQRGVVELSGVTYERIDDDGLHVRVGEEARVLDVDHVVICAGQEARRTLFDELDEIGYDIAHGQRPGQSFGLDLIGGARRAAELDAKRAIAHGTRVASRI